MDTYFTLFHITTNMGGRRRYEQWRNRLNTKAKVFCLKIFKMYSNVYINHFVFRLMNWIQGKIPELPIKNFTTDWNDGKRLGALVDSVAPGLCPDWPVRDIHSHKKIVINLTD